VKDKYLGDKYVKAYTFFRNKQDEKVSNLTLRVAELERYIEWISNYLMEEKK